MQPPAVSIAPESTDNRRYPGRPLVGAGALIFDRGKVLLVQRGKAPLKGYWSLPGGMVELGETLEDAVCREVLEETSLVVKVDCLGELFERILRDAAGKIEYHYVLADYVCRIAGGSLAAAGDAADARWVTIKDLDSVQLTSGTREVIERCYAKHKRRRARV